MSWNNGYERKKFEARQKKQAEEYKAQGMTEEQIKAMYEFDLEQYRVIGVITCTHSRFHRVTSMTARMMIQKARYSTSFSMN